MGKEDRGFEDLLAVLREERPPTTLFRCSTAAVKNGMRNSDFVGSQLLEDVHIAMQSAEEEDEA